MFEFDNVSDTNKSLQSLNVVCSESQRSTCVEDCKTVGFQSGVCHENGAVCACEFPTVDQNPICTMGGNLSCQIYCNDLGYIDGYCDTKMDCCCSSGSHDQSCSKYTLFFLLSYSVTNLICSSFMTYATVQLPRSGLKTAKILDGYEFYVRNLDYPHAKGTVRQLVYS